MLREAFKDLLKRWGRAHDLLFVPEHTITTPQKNRIYLDGALLHALRVPFGYWEAKDADDDLDAEIAAKSRKGYRLGNRSAIDWVLDQHKEKKPRDPTIAAKFNTYRFADYKESMITLLAKVTRVSVETNAITTAMRKVDRSGWG